MSYSALFDFGLTFCGVTLYIALHLIFVFSDSCAYLPTCTLLACFVCQMSQCIKCWILWLFQSVFFLTKRYAFFAFSRCTAQQSMITEYCIMHNCFNNSSHDILSKISSIICICELHINVLQIGTMCIYWKRHKFARLEIHCDLVMFCSWKIS